MLKEPDFLHLDTNSLKLKLVEKNWRGRGHK